MEPKPLGRNPLCTRPAFGVEFEMMKADMLALPPANSNENARLHRDVAVRHNPALAPIFTALRLEFTP